MQLLKADTSTKVVIGPVVSVSDGYTPVTTLSLSTADEAELLKHDAAAVTDISGNTFAALTGADGYYNLTITAAQTDTEGRLTVLVNDDSLCLPVRHDFMVVNANVYDSLYAAATTDYLQVDVTQVAGATEDIATETKQNTAQADLDILTGTDGVTLATSQPNYTPAVAGDSMALTAAAVDAIWDEPIAGHLTAGTAGLSEALGSAALVDSTITGTPTTTTFTFTGGSTSNDFYNDQLVYILSGTGIGQVRPVLSSSYSGGTTTITVDEVFIVTPAASDRFAILVSHVHPKSQITADIDANSTQLAAIVADTNELQSDWVNGGRLDLIIDELTTQGDTNQSKIDVIDGIVDAILVDTGTSLPATLGTPAGASMSADIAAIQTDTNAIEVDTQDIQSRLPAALVGGKMDSDVTAISGDTVAADNLEASLETMLVGTATGGTTSTVTSALTGYGDDTFIGRVLIFRTGTLQYEAGAITDYTSTTGTFTFAANTWTTSPTTETFVIV